MSANAGDDAEADCEGGDIEVDKHEGLSHLKESG
jgi:hypothetical protein